MTRIRFEDLPSTNTPRNAENLNKLNNVVISPAEPTTGEEVWIQKSKNLFNINGEYEKKTGMPTINDGSITLPNSDGNSGYTKFLKKIEISGPITISFIVSNSVGYARPLLMPLDSNGSVVTDLTIEGYTYLDVYKGYYRDYANGNYEQVINFPSNVKYFRLGFIHISATFTNIQIEQGSTVTSYEPYIDNKIFVKNDNGIYEEFLSKKEIEDNISNLQKNTVETKYLGKNPNINNLHYKNAVYGLYNCEQAPNMMIGVLEVLVYTGDWVVQRFTDTDSGNMWQRQLHSGTIWTEWKQKW